MSNMKLTIAPLSTPGSISYEACEAIKNAKRLFIQTECHPSSKWLREYGCGYMAMDDIYDEAEDFDELNARIAERLLSTEEDAVYAPVGRGVSDALLQALKQRALTLSNDTRIVVLPGTGYADAAIAAAGQPFSASQAMVAAASTLPDAIDTHIPLCIEEIDTRLRASEVKLALGEYYPDDMQVIFCHMEQDGTYSCKSIKLYELDRQWAYFAATTLLIEPCGLEELSSYGIDSLVDVVNRLRGPSGCPWDREQTHKSIEASLIEESYEVIDAIDRDDMSALCEELGDVLLQVVFHAQIESEKHDFNIRDVTTGIVQKLMYRHPHVFGSVSVSGTEEVLKNWDELKNKEKRLGSIADTLNAVPKSFPALMRSQKLIKRASKGGYEPYGAVEGIDALIAQAEALKANIEAKGSSNAKGSDAALEAMLGDMLFTLCQAASGLKIDAELALMRRDDEFCDKFSQDISKSSKCSVNKD